MIIKEIDKDNIFINNNSIITNTELNSNTAETTKFKLVIEIEDTNLEVVLQKNSFPFSYIDDREDSGDIYLIHYLRNEEEVTLPNISSIIYNEENLYNENNINYSPMLFSYNNNFKKIILENGITSI